MSPLLSGNHELLYQGDEGLYRTISICLEIGLYSLGLPGAGSYCTGLNVASGCVQAPYLTGSDVFLGYRRYVRSTSRPCRWFVVYAP